MYDYYDKIRKSGVDIQRKQIMMIWHFKQKHHTYGQLNKNMPSLCCHGRQQKLGVQYCETHAPVVSRMAVRT